jgi:hypothetical protein
MEDEGLDLGAQVSAMVIKYDPANDEELEFYVEVLDGSHAGVKKDGLSTAFPAMVRTAF